MKADTKSLQETMATQQVSREETATTQEKVQKHTEVVAEKLRKEKVELRESLAPEETTHMEKNDGRLTPEHSEVSLKLSDDVSALPKSSTKEILTALTATKLQLLEETVRISTASRSSFVLRDIRVLAIQASKPEGKLDGIKSMVLAREIQGSHRRKKLIYQTEMFDKMFFRRRKRKKQWQQHQLTFTHKSWAFRALIYNLFMASKKIRRGASIKQEHKRNILIGGKKKHLEQLFGVGMTNKSKSFIFFTIDLGFRVSFSSQKREFSIALQNELM